MRRASSPDDALFLFAGARMYGNLSNFLWLATPKMLAKGSAPHDRLMAGILIAREYGKPCVVGIDQVVTTLQDGEMVEVDGTKGVVRLLLEFERQRTNRSSQG